MGLLLLQANTNSSHNTFELLNSIKQPCSLTNAQPCSGKSQKNVIDEERLTLFKRGKNKNEMVNLKSQLNRDLEVLSNTGFLVKAFKSSGGHNIQPQFLNNFNKIQTKQMNFTIFRSKEDNIITKTFEEETLWVEHGYMDMAIDRILLTLQRRGKVRKVSWLKVSQEFRFPRHFFQPQMRVEWMILKKKHLLQDFS
ncbi:hypothetical protein ABPG72_013994 [Tetrahymena utriculariae]